MKTSEKKLASVKAWKKANPDKVREYRRKYNKLHPVNRTEYHKWYEENYKDKRQALYLEYKNKFFVMYGDKCACCGEINKEFLTIEHRNGQVGKKKDSWAYRKATNEYRPDLYEVLCMNCNFSKGKYGYCPHQLGR